MCVCVCMYKYVFMSLMWTYCFFLYRNIYYIYPKVSLLCLFLIFVEENTILLILLTFLYIPNKYY